MRVLILGSGGREHALAHKLAASPLLSKLYVAPGNPGTAEIAENIPCQATDITGVIRLLKELSIELLVVGPEDPLAQGIVDTVHSEVPSCLIFGPTREACRLEWSKGYSKDFMDRHDIPTADWQHFKSLQDAREYLENCPLPTAIKTDGLAAGKGVVIAFSPDDVQRALETLPLDKPVVIEEYLVGREISLHIITDGENYHVLELAEDHKQLLDGDRGPNTGGMGTYSPLELAPHIFEQATVVVEKTLSGLRAEGISYQGTIFIGLMLTKDGLKVLEYNCRFGDPETQVMLVRLQSDLLPYLVGAASKSLPQEPMCWARDSAVCVVACGPGYPASSSKGLPISGITVARQTGCIVYHAGTAQHQDHLVTSGGRILNVIGQGEDIETARKQAYDGLRHIHFDGMQFRRDIGRRYEANLKLKT